MTDFMIVAFGILLMSPLILWAYKPEGQIPEEKDRIKERCATVEEWTGSRFVEVENANATTEAKARVNPVTGDYKVMERF